jgi:hypothetical protein
MIVKKIVNNKIFKRSIQKKIVNRGDNYKECSSSSRFQKKDNFTAASKTQVLICTQHTITQFKYSENHACTFKSSEFTLQICKKILLVWLSFLLQVGLKRVYCVYWYAENPWKLVYSKNPRIQPSEWKSVKSDTHRYYVVVFCIVYQWV